MLEEGTRNNSCQNGPETTGEQAEHKRKEDSAERACDLVSQSRYPAATRERGWRRGQQANLPASASISTASRAFKT